MQLHLGMGTEKATVVKEYAMHAEDVGSPGVQIALLTAKIKHLTNCLKGNKHDNSMRRGLIRAVNQRNRQLRYLARTDVQKYREVASKLDIRVK